MLGHFCIAFIDFMLNKFKSRFNSFFPNNQKKNEIIPVYSE